jgi:type I restriction enzyme, S subunit
VSNWPVIPLRAITEDAQTGPFGSQLHSEEYVDNEIPVINPSNIIQGKLVPDFSVTVNEKTAHRLSRHTLMSGDMIFARRGELGRAAIVGDDAAGWLCGTGSLRVRTRPSVLDSRFANYILQSTATRSYFEAKAVGSTMGNLNTSIVLSLPIPFPDVKDQVHTANFLDAGTAHIDTLLATKHHMIELLRERVTAKIASAFGVTIGFSPAGIPESVGQFQMVRLGAVSTVQSGLTLDSGRELDESAVSRPYLRVANVQDGWVDLSEVKEVRVSRRLASSSELRAGDVLMTEGGDPDKLGRGTVWGGEIPGCLHQNHIFAVRPNPVILPEFLALLTRTPYARTYFEVTASKTTGIASTSTTKIASFRVPLLAVDMQLKIVADITQAVGRINSLSKAIERQIGLLQERRQALITAALAGDLDILRSKRLSAKVFKSTVWQSYRELEELRRSRDTTEHGARNGLLM